MSKSEERAFKVKMIFSWIGFHPLVYKVGNQKEEEKEGRVAGVLKVLEVTGDPLTVT